MDQQKKISILIIGATGNLGSLITKHALLREELTVNVTIRDPTKNSELVQKVKDQGGNVYTLDLTNPEEIKGITQNIHTVVCALSGPNTGKIQQNLLDDGIETGLKRFVPTEYSANIEGIPEGDHPWIDSRRQFREKINQTKSIKGIFVQSGMFLDYFFKSNTVEYWGNQDQLLGVSTYEETARVLVHALCQSNYYGILNTIIQQVNAKDLAEVIKRVTKKEAELVNKGTLDECKEQARVLESEGKAFDSGLLKLVYFHSNGLGLIDQLKDSEGLSFKFKTLDDVMSEILLQ